MFIEDKVTDTDISRMRLCPSFCFARKQRWNIAFGRLQM